MIFRFIIVAKNGMHFLKKRSEKTEHFCMKHVLFVSLSDKIQHLIKPLLKNDFSTHFQGTGPWEGSIHFRRFVA